MQVAFGEAKVVPPRRVAVAIPTKVLAVVAAGLVRLSVAPPLLLLLLLLLRFLAI